MKKYPLLNFAPRHEDVLGSGGVSSFIINLGTRWRWVDSFTPRSLYSQGKTPRYPLFRRMEWAPEPVWSRWQGIELRFSSPEPITILTELPFLLKFLYKTFFLEASEEELVQNFWGNLDGHVMWSRQGTCFFVALNILDTDVEFKFTELQNFIRDVINVINGFWIISNLHNTRIG
jgi:hypothetical protein